MVCYQASGTETDVMVWVFSTLDGLEMFDKVQTIVDLAWQRKIVTWGRSQVEVEVEVVHGSQRMVQSLAEAESVHPQMLNEGRLQVVGEVGGPSFEVEKVAQARMVAALAVAVPREVELLLMDRMALWV